MPTYAVLLMHRVVKHTPIGSFGESLGEVTIRPRPLTDSSSQPIALEAESPELALSAAIRRFPHFRHLLATQEIHAYLASIGQLSSDNADASRVFRSPKARSPHHENPTPLRGERISG